MPPLDFPNAPTNGQTFPGPDGALWKWDGIKWIAVPGTAGSVTSVATGTGLTGGPIVSSGTISLLPATTSVIGGLTDAPNDAQSYVRKSLGWAVAQPGGVTSFNTRTGAVTLASGDVTTALTYTPYNATNPANYTTQTYVDSAVGTKIGDAPNDGKPYARQSQSWVISTTGVAVGDTPPVTPNDGSMWFDSVGLQLYLRYNDGNSTQWVPTTAQQAPPVAISDTPPTLATGNLWWDSSIGNLYVRFDDGNSQQWVTAANLAGLANAATKAEIAAAYNDVGRNLLHNTLLNVWQRGVGPWTGNGSYTADRWVMGFNGGTLSVYPTAFGDVHRTQIGDEAAITALVINVVGGSGAGDDSFVEQRIESVRRLAGKTVTLSFWAAAPSGGNKLGILAWQNFGTGGSPSGLVIVPAIPCITLSTAYTRYSVTFTYPSVAGKTFGTNAGTDYSGLRFAVSSGATNTPLYGGLGVQTATIGIWGMQLEVGSTVTSLEKPDPSDDLRRCQRFYQTGYVSILGHSGGAAAYLGSQVQWTATMRIAPSVTFSGAAYTNSSNLIADLGTNMGARFWITGTAAGSAQVSATYYATADL